MSILILILLRDLFCEGSRCQLHDSNFAGDTPASTVQCDFAERELASSRTTGLRRSLISAAVASGEVAASEQSVAVGT